MLFESKQVKHYNCIYYGNYLNKCGRAYLFFLALHSTLILLMILKNEMYTVSKKCSLFYLTAYYLFVRNNFITNRGVL